MKPTYKKPVVFVLQNEFDKKQLRKIETARTLSLPHTGALGAEAAMWTTDIRGNRTLGAEAALWTTDIRGNLQSPFPTPEPHEHELQRGTSALPSTQYHIEPSRTSGSQPVGPDNWKTHTSNDLKNGGTAQQQNYS